MHSIIDSLQQLRLNQLLLPQNPYTGTISIQQIPMLYELSQFDLRHVHERVDLVLGPLEVLDAEGVDGHHLDAGLVADFQYLVPNTNQSVIQWVWIDP
jgi:hypothetical protein